MAEQTVTYLRMTQPEQLRPGNAAPAPVPVQLKAMGFDQSDLAKSIYKRIGKKYGWPEKPEWIEAVDERKRHFHLIVAGEETLGLAKIINHGNGSVEISTFGLVPEYVNRGYGAAALTAVVREAWRWALSGNVNGQVWLRTSSIDHPHALRNYLARGFQAYKQQIRDLDTDEVKDEQTISLSLGDLPALSAS
jgi:GNAT superfamily N-acetyltransferase